MIRVYSADCSDFSANGNGPMSLLCANLTETMNGEYGPELEGELHHLMEGCILRAG